jgi:hypothetical protein
LDRSLGSEGKIEGRTLRTRVALSVLVTLLVATCVAFALRGNFRTSRSQVVEQDSPEESASSSDFQMELRLGTFQARNRRLVYPYSVIPGGIDSGDELRVAAAHDPVIGAHYSGFDYRVARLVEVKRPRAVYVSYRRNGKIFWTHKQATLHPGEKLLTDGRMTARTRCGNQVSVLPQVNTSPFEPEMAELDRPDGVASGIAQAFPGNLEASLFRFDPFLPLESAGGLFASRPQAGAFVPLSLGGAPFGPIVFSKPPGGGTGGGPGAPGGGGGGGTGGGGTGGGGGGTGGGGGGAGGGGGTGGGSGGGCVGSSCNPPNSPPPPVVPEPATAALVISGVAAIVIRLRNTRS